MNKTYVMGEPTAVLPATAVCGGLATGLTVGGDAKTYLAKEIKNWHQKIWVIAQLNSTNTETITH